MKKLIFAALLLLAGSAQAENTGLSESVDLWMGTDTSNKCYADSAPQQPGGYRVYCNGGAYYPNNGPTTYRHVPELPRMKIKDALANPTRQPVVPAPKPVIAPLFTDDWQDWEGGVVRGSKLYLPGADKSLPRLVIERIVLNGARAVRVFEAHGYPVCEPERPTCVVLVRQLQSATWGYRNTGDFHTVTTQGRFNDTFITDSKLADIIWDSPDYTMFITGLKDTFMFKASLPRTEGSKERSFRNN